MSDSRKRIFFKKIRFQLKNILCASKGRVPKQYQANVIKVREAKQVKQNE